MILYLQGAMMSVAFKEGLKIPPPAMNEIILSANQDIRQVTLRILNLNILFVCACLCNILFKQYEFVRSMQFNAYMYRIFDLICTGFT